MVHERAGEELLSSADSRPGQSRRATMRRVRIVRGVGFVVLGGAMAVWLRDGDPREVELPLLLRGRLVTKLPGVSVAKRGVGWIGLRDDHLAGQSAVTDGAGRFEFRGRHRGTVTVGVGVPAGAPFTARALTGVVLPAGREVVMELIEGVTVEGRVVDANTGEPVASIWVAWQGSGQVRRLDLSDPGSSILTDRQGIYRFHAPPGPVSVQVESGIFKSPEERPRIQGVILEGARTFTLPDLVVRHEPPPARSSD